MANNNQNMGLEQYGRVTTQTDTTYNNAPTNMAEPSSGGLWSDIKTAFSMSTDKGSNASYFGDAQMAAGGGNGNHWGGLAHSVVLPLYFTLSVLGLG